MRRPRIIPILCLDSIGELISTVSFGSSTYIGDPLNAIAVYNSFVDELGYEIYASRESRSFNLQLLKTISDECKTPLFAGGGVSSLKDIEEYLLMVFEGCLSSAVIKDPEFLNQASKELDIILIVCLDCIRSAMANIRLWIAHDCKVLVKSLIHLFSITEGWLGRVYYSVSTK